MAIFHQIIVTLSPLSLYYELNMSSTQRPRRFIKRPDDKAMNQDINALRDEIKKLDLTNNEINAQIDKTVLDPQTAEKRKALQNEMKEVISKQGNLKLERNAIQEQIRNVDTNLKRMFADIQKLTSKNNYKSVSEIDSRVKYLDDLVGAGNLKLADERRHVKEMTSLRKLRKDFAEVEKQQEAIDKEKAKIADLKKKLAAVGNKEVQQQFERIQKELDTINESNKSIYNKRTELINKRNEIRKTKDAKYDQIRKLRAEFDEEFAKFKKALAEEQKKRDEEYKSQQAEQKQAKLKEIADQKLAEASIPAFTHEINEIHTLLAYFEPTYVKPQVNAVAEATKSTAFQKPTTTRQVEMPEDVVILKKEQQSFFEGSKQKRNKKKSAKAKNFTVDSDVIISLTDLSIPLPTKADDVPNTIDILKETLSALQDKQEEQTKVNVEKAKAEIAKLEAQDAENEEVEESEVVEEDA